MSENLDNAISCACGLLQELTEAEFNEAHEEVKKLIINLGFEVKEFQFHGSAKAKINPKDETLFGDVMRFIKIFNR